MSLSTEICEICEEGTSEDLRVFLNTLDKNKLKEENKNNVDEENFFLSVMKNDPIEYPMINILYDFGFDINHKKDGKTVLYECVVQKNEAFFNIIKNKPNLNIKKVHPTQDLIYFFAQNANRFWMDKVISLYEEKNVDIDMNRFAYYACFARNYTALRWLNKKNSVDYKIYPMFVSALENHKRQSSVFFGIPQIDLNIKKILVLFMKNDVNLFADSDKSFKEVSSVVKDWITKNAVDYQKKKINKHTAISLKKKDTPRI